MEGEESLRTVDCLRGRLLAERVASRNANMEAHQLGNKLSELENLLKKEAKSRNRAEKKLKSLMKKLESKNISYDSSELGLLDRSDVTSTSSSSSSSSSTPSSKSQDGNPKNSQITNLKRNDSQTSMSSHGSPATEDINSASSELDGKPHPRAEFAGSMCPALGVNPFSETMEPSCQDLSSPGEVHSEGSNELESSQSYSNSSSDKLSVKSCTEEGSNEEHDQILEKNQEYEENQEKKHENGKAEESHVDNSLALVLLEEPLEKTKQSIDPEVLDTTVKEVLDALRHAREQLQSSMERKRRSMNMIKVG